MIAEKTTPQDSDSSLFEACGKREAVFDFHSKGSFPPSIFRSRDTNERWKSEPSSSLLARNDEDVAENNNFRVLSLLPKGMKRAEGAVLLLHGLNERSWDKYLPWAEALAEKTRKAVILFPLAFRMDRAPVDWATPRKMRGFSLERVRKGIVSSTFLNAAISVRLERAPERFFLSGLASYRDIVELAGLIRAGDFPCIEAGSSVDFFGYSAGALLSQMLLMAGPDTLFSASRAFLFCGGATLDRMNPVSRYIMDSEAAFSLQEYYAGEFVRDIDKLRTLKSGFPIPERLTDAFISMLHIESGLATRRKMLSPAGERLKALCLKKDSVMRPADIAESLSGCIPDSGVMCFDFPFPYTHEVPFPQSLEYSRDVMAASEKVFSLASDFLS
jgi:pimeloyl-ACP methyl ester carboxylesterase